MEQPDIINDFTRRYAQSYIWVKFPGSAEESMFYVERITSDAEKIALLYLWSPEYGRIVINMGTTHKLLFKYPPVGVFQNGKDAAIFRRYPAKQYKHGIYHGNSHIYPVTHPLYGKAKDADALKFEDVQAAFKAETMTFNQALQTLRRGEHRSIALRNNFSLTAPITKNGDLLLLQWETPIASLSPTGETVYVFDKTLANVIDRVKGQ